MAVRITDGGLSWAATIDDSELNRVATRIEGRFSSVAQSAKAEGASMESFAKSAARAAAGYLSLQAAGGFISQMVAVRGEFQQTEVAFTTMLQSKDKANKLMAQMVDLAATTPFTLSEVAKSGKQLLAYGFAADTITENLTQLGNIAAGVSAPIGDIAYLFGTLRTQGRAFTKDIREFSGRGIPIIAELAKVLNTSEKNVSLLVESGKVGFPEVQKAFDNMTSSGGMFFNLMKEQSKTLTGQLSNLSDAWDMMLNTLGKSQQGIFSGGIEAAAELVKNYDAVLSSITILVIGYGVYRAALMATAAYERVAMTSSGSMALSINNESIARIKNAASMLTEMRASVSNLAAQRAAAAQTLSSDLLILQSAKQRLAAAEAIQVSNAMGVATQQSINRAKAIQAATDDVIAAKEQASISRKASVAAATAFATGQSELETTAKVANSAATVELTAVESLQTANKRIAIAVTSAYNAVLLATPAIAFAAAITALGVAIYAFAQTTSAAVVSQKALNEILVEVAGKYAEQKLTVTDYVKIIKDASSTENERTAALKKLTELSPKILGALNAQNISTQQGSAAIKEYLKWLDAKLQGEAAYVIKSDAVKRMAERNIKAGLEGNELDGGLDWTTRLGYSLKNLFTGKVNLKASDDASDIVKELNSHDQAIIDAVNKKYGAALKQRAIDGITPETPDLAVVKNKAFYEAIVTKNTEDLEALDSSTKDFAAKSKPLIAKIKAAKLALLNFDVSDKAGKRAAKEEDGALKRQAEMLQKIYDLNDKYNNKSLTGDEQKLADIRGEFKSLQADIDQYNKDPKNKKINPNLKPELEKALINQQYDNDTKLLAIELERQKDLYAKYEQFKTDRGADSAKARFENEKKFDSSITYLDRLKAEKKSLEKDPVTMTGKEIERYQMVTKLINDEVIVQKAAYDALLFENSTFGQLKAAAIERYNSDISKLEGKANEGRRAVRTQFFLEEMDSIKNNALQKTEAFKKAAQEAFVLSRQQLIQQTRALETLLASGTLPDEQVKNVQKSLDSLKFTMKIGVDQGNLASLKDEFTRVSDQLHAKDGDGNEIILSDADYKAVITRLAAIGIKIGEIDKNGDGTASWADGVVENFDYLQKGAGFEEFAKGASVDLGALAGSFNELSGALGGNETQAGYLLDTIGQLAGAAGDAAGAAASFANGDIVGGITKTISAVTKVLGIAKKVKEMNAAARKEVEDFYINAIKGERAYQDLLKERELQTVRNNKVALQGIRDELALRRSQMDAYAEESAEIMAKLQGQQSIASESSTHGTWFRKAKVNKTYASLAGQDFQQLSQLLAQGKLEGETKALVERLVELEQKGYDAEAAIAALAQETSELFTGTTADNLTNTLANMFAEGKTSAADLADFFKTSMDDAALSIFKNKVLAKAMETFYAEFDKAAQSGDELTSEEIARLNGLFTSLTGDALKRFEEFQKITGSSLNGSDNASNPDTLRGRVESITMDQADVLSGNIAGLRLTQLETNVILKPIGMSLLQQLGVAQLHLDIAIKNEQNTYRTANNTDSLLEMKTALISINKKMDNSANALAGAGHNGI
jgi:hypothetical protein